MTGAEEELNENLGAHRHLVQSQFAQSTRSYLNSTIHAKGQSLQRLSENIEPQPTWSILDVATGPGHTAVLFSGQGASITAVDLTLEMLITASEEAEEADRKDLTFCQADAQHLPFRSGSFDLVTCRLAAHHFSDVFDFVADAARVLANGGQLAIVDNIVPGSSVRSRKRKKPKDAGKYINAFERLRDPSHCRSLTLEEWQELFYSTGLRLTHTELLDKRLDFVSWTERKCVSVDNCVRLEVMLLHAPEAAHRYFRPEVIDSRLTFSLTEAILVGIKGR